MTTWTWSGWWSEIWDGDLGWWSQTCDDDPSFVCHPDLDLDLVILTWPLTLTCLRYSSDLPSSDDLLSTSTWPGPGLGFHPEIHPDILTLTLTLP
jgi:hypothetical protein